MAINPEIEITIDDVRLIMRSRFKHLDKAVNNVFCRKCSKGGTSAMTVDKIWLNHLGDIILEGHCKVCNQATNRYVETGEDPDSYDQAMAIRELKIDVLKDYKSRF